MLGICGKSVHIPPLTFGVDRVEGQRRLAASAESGDDDEFAAWYGQADAFEIVCLGTLYLYIVFSLHKDTGVWCLLFVRLVERHEERIGHAFGSDVRHRTVSCHDADVAVKMHELFEDAPHELVIVASRVVSAAYGTCKKGVAAENDLFVSFEIAYSSACMSRCLKHFELEGADLDRLAVSYRVESARERRIPYGLDHREGLRKRKAEGIAYVRVGLFKRRELLQMGVDGYAIFLGEGAHAVDVVEMTVGQHDAYRLEGLGFHQRDKCFTLAFRCEARVGECAISLLVPYYAAARLQCVEYKMFCSNHSKFR